jgi:transcriptional regulator with XRE-family HTH domain
MNYFVSLYNLFQIRSSKKEVQISQREFSKKIFISQSTLGEIETGVRNVNDRIIELICSQYNVSREWLRDGKGEIYDTKKPDITFEHLTEIFNQLSKPLQEYLLKQAELILKAQDETIDKK